MAKTPNRMKDADEFSTFTNDQFIKKKADGTGFESAAGGTEVNNLETICTNIAADEVPVGNVGGGVSTYKALPNGVVKYDTSTHNFSAAGLADLGLDTDLATFSVAASSTVSGSNTGDEPDATTTVKGIVELATDGENAANVVVQGNDARLSNDRTASGLRTATTVVSISGATAPTANQILIASSGTAAAWNTIVTANIGNDQVTLAKIAPKTDTNPGLIGYDADGNPVEIEEGSSGQPLLSGGTAAAPAFGTLGTAAFADNTIAVSRLANGTDGQLITWDASGVATTVATGTAGHVLTSAGTGAAPSFTNVRGKFSIGIETPAVADVLPVHLTDRAITITEIIHQCYGATSVEWRLFHGTGAGTGGTGVGSGTITSTTTITSTAISTNNVVADNNGVYYDATALVGTPTNLIITVYYTEN